LEKKKKKLRLLSESENTFEKVARFWIGLKSKNWAHRHAERITRSRKLDVFPVIGNIAINEIDTLMLRTCIDPIQSRGALDIASRMRQRCEQVFEYGRAIGACSNNPATPLKVIMVSPVKQNFPALEPNEMLEFLAKLRAYSCNVQIRIS
jgi:integrase